MSKPKPIFAEEVNKAFLINWREISSTGCWLWLGYKTGRGYGKLYTKEKILAVHRLALMLWKNIPIGTNYETLHTCDVRNCFNPEHLIPGTHKQNMQDACIKKRTAWGVRSSRCKLSQTQVLELRKICMALVRGNKIKEYQRLADLYNCHWSTIRNIGRNNKRRQD